MSNYKQSTLPRCKQCRKVLKPTGGMGMDGNNENDVRDFENACFLDDFCVCGQGGAAGSSGYWAESRGGGAYHPDKSRGSGGAIRKQYNPVTGVFE
jgi:hypothetical protein